MRRNLLLPVALVAALIGGSVGAFVVHNQNSSNTDTATIARTTPATYTDVSNPPTTELASATSANQLAANNSLRFQTAQEQTAYRDGFGDGFQACGNGRATSGSQAARYSSPNVVYRNQAARSSSSSSRRVYYDYNNQPRSRTFWQKHRDKLTVAAGTGGGALLGGLIGGKKGAGIGALAGAGGSALYTYKIRKRSRRY
ncbi:MAG: hypothetical protein ABJC05_08820 [Pyrinomonadaceae bacterium]